MKKLFLLILISFFIFSCGNDEDKKCTKNSCPSGEFCSSKTEKCEKEERPNPCDPNPCLHGICSSNNDTFQCSCENGFTGEKCEKEESQEVNCKFGTFDNDKKTCIGNKDAISEIGITGQSPNDMILHNNFLYILNSTDNNIQKLDLVTNTSSNFIQVDAGSNPYEFVLKDNKFYISNSVANSISIFNLDGTEVKKSISFEEDNAFFTPQALAINDDNIFISNVAFDYEKGYDDGFITILSNDHSFFKKIITSQKNPQSMLISDNKLFVINSGEIFFDPNNNWLSTPKSASGIDIIDLNNLNKATNIEIPIIEKRGSLKSYTLCNDKLNITGRGLNLYSFDYNKLEMIHSTDNPVVIEEESEEKNHMLSLKCVKNHLFIIDGNTDTLYIMDKDNKVIMKLEEIDNDNEFNSMPQKLAYDDLNNKLYVMFGISKKVSVIDLNKL